MVADAPSVEEDRTALATFGLVRTIACYHLVRIFNCREYACRVSNAGTKFGGYEVTLTNEPFNDAYRYVDWFLTAPLLLIELLCVMDLRLLQRWHQCWRLRAHFVW